jgi:Na+-transporting methylmalonyl-CoA/oxaloacetate decarboxylase gamma subunit
MKRARSIVTAIIGACIYLTFIGMAFVTTTAGG